MKQSRPQLKSKKLIILPLILLAAAILIFPSAAKAGAFSPVVQLTAMLAAAFSLFLLIKYVVYDYLYTLDGGNLFVHKVSKNRSVCAAEIPLSQVDGLPLDRAAWRARRHTEKGPIKTYTFVKNPGDAATRYLIFRQDGTRYALAIEPDAAFLGALCDEIRAVRHSEPLDSSFDKE